MDGDFHRIGRLPLYLFAGVDTMKARKFLAASGVNAAAAGRDASKAMAS